jgi:short-chain fatty acids transporter
MSISEQITNIFKRLLPSPFTIAIFLTIATFIFAYFFTPSKSNHHLLDLFEYWENGLWNDTNGGLYFAFQMMLMLVLGHVLALTKPISNGIDTLTNRCTHSSNAAFIVTFTTIFVSLFNWGLGLIFGAILARKVGEKFHDKNEPLNYGLIGAAAYSGLMVWHGGISGSAPLKAAESNNLREFIVNSSTFDLSTIPEAIPISATIFSPMNLTVSAVLLIILPLLMYFIGKKNHSSILLPKKELILLKKDLHKPIGAEVLDYSRWFSMILGLCFLSYALYKAFILPENFSFKFMTPNFLNFLLFGLGLTLHKSVSHFIGAANKAISGATGILIQFPLYFGILGIMLGSGLILQLSEVFVDYSSPTTFPLLTFISAGIVNIFVPSGGAQWAVQGPIIVNAATQLGVSLPKAIMALAYGDQLTNMLQPFWALPLLGITGLKAKDILPYTLLLFLVGGLIFFIGLILF